MYRPGGLSSDEEDEFGSFSFGHETKTHSEVFKEKQIELCKQRIESENNANNRMYNAIQASDIDTVKAILDGGFDINSCLLTDWTPIFLAASHAIPNIVSELLERGADIHTKRDGSTLLMAACSIQRQYTSNEKVFTVTSNLIEKGVDVVATDKKRRTAFILACEQGYLNVVEMLLPLSDINKADNQGWTGLFYAVHENLPEIVKLLLDNGLSPYEEDIRFYNVIYYAQNNDYQEILKLLPIDYDEFVPDNNYQNETNFEEFFKIYDKPTYYTDIDTILYGMYVANLIPLFQEKKIDLVSLLTADHEYLESIGVVLSGHRKKILKGLYRFHKSPWKASSVPFTARDTFYSTINLLEELGNVVKHTAVMDCSIKFLLNEHNESQEYPKSVMIRQGILRCLNRLGKIKRTLKRLDKMAIRFEQEKPADFIEGPLPPKKSLFSWPLILGVAAPTVYIVYRYVR